MNSFSESGFHDYSTTPGKIRQFLNRINWKWATTAILVGALVVLHFLSAGNVNTPEESEVNLMLTSAIPTSSRLQAALSTPIPSEFIYNGPDSSDGIILTNFSGYKEITGRDKGILTSLTLRNAYVDAPSLSESLEGFVNLETISLENIWLIDNFTRVYLPKLSHFIYQQNRGDKRDSYKTPASLKSTLFFDKVEKASWDVEKDLLNMGIVIKISKAGTKLIEIDRPSGEVYLNVKYCQNMLQNVQGAFSALSLITCNVTEDIVPLIPKNVKYLNMRNTIPSTNALVQILKRQTQLVEFYGWFNFYCDWPGYEVFLNIADLPKTTKTVGINNLDVSCNPGFKSPITDFAIGDFVSRKIVTDFHKIFVNIKRVGVFNISTSSAYPLLENILKTKAESIALVKFERIDLDNAISASEENGEYSILTEVRPTVQGVESFLTKLGIDKNASDILIEMKGGIYSGRQLTELEKNTLRYKGLGFNKVDNLEDYLLWDALELPNTSDKISTTAG